MRDMAKVQIVGRAGGAFTIRSGKNGYFKLAVSGKSKKNPDGSWNNDVPPSWYTITVIGEKAVESINKLNIQKGEQLYVSGDQEIRSYEKDGVKYTYPEITVFTAADIQPVFRPKAEAKAPAATPPYASQQRQEAKKAQDADLNWGELAPTDNH